MTVIANEAPITETYSASPIASGTRATIVVAAVIAMGLSLAMPAIISALFDLYPLFRKIFV